METGARRVVVALVAATAMIACGGDDDDSSGAPSSPATSSAATVEATTVDTAAAGAARVALVVDTDLAADDLVALYYLTAHPAVDLLAVTVSGTGEVRCPRGADVARGLLATLGLDDVPVACGVSQPLSGDRVFPVEWRDAADNAYGLPLRIVAPPADAPDAAELLADVVASTPAPLTLLTLGPLTNVAHAFAADPSLAGALGRVVVMGGAVDVPGNVEVEGAAPLPAEWNLYIDPDAASAVATSGAPVTFVALDATNAVPISTEMVDRLAANNRSAAAAAVLSLLAAWTPPYMWDPLAAIAATDPELVPGREVELAVVTEGEDSGRTVVQAGGAPVVVADPPDADRVIDHLLRTLAGVPADEPLAAPTTLPVIAELSFDFDGTTCAYDGAASLAQGAYRIHVGPGPVPYWVGVAHLTEGATVDEALAWIAEHPDEEPPMIDEAVAVGEGALESPGTVELRAGTVGFVCITEDNALHHAASVTVTG